MASAIFTENDCKISDKNAAKSITRTPSDNRYQYSALAERDIRLVRCCPNSTTDDQAQILCESGLDEVCIEILHVPLDSAPAFTAVSYTWGDTVEPAKVSISGGSCLVTTARVHDILDRLQQDQHDWDGDILIWIDQLCIDQHNDIEKSQQIRLMRHVYSKATRTFIILSQLNFESNSALIAIGRLAESGHLQPRTSASGGLKPQLFGSDGLVERAWVPDDLAPTTLEHFRHERFCADFDTLISDPVFQRAWIYQEIKSSRLAFVIAKTHALHWDMFSAAVEIQIAVNKVPTQAPELQHTHLRALSLMAEDRICTMAGGHKDWMLLHVQAQGVLLSSDKRDLTLALTTFEDFYEHIPPYHVLSASMLYRGFTSSMITSYRSLEVWAAISGAWNAPHRASDLPSWCPDWSTPRETVPFYWPRDQYPTDTPFNADKGYHHDSKEGSKPSGGLYILRVCGKQIDSLARTVEPAYTTLNFEDSREDFLNLRRACRMWLDHAEAAGAPLVDEISFETIKPLMAALTAACTNLRISDGSALRLPGSMDPILLDELRWMYTYCKELDAGEILYHDGRPHALSVMPRLYGSFKEAVRVLKNCMKTCIGRRIAFGKTQGLGLVPRPSCEGDVVCILHGSKVPVVLRRIGSRYRLVGQCYWHDWMCGEAVNWSEDEGDVFEIF
ncbi:hypothetical protein LTR97_012202 [Elasticomyces elasticus]|uniref:Heterokaryon incompatibility domain-containing protein n=1 Tax=Elasticomyces elasticus TaxID=574655 RepID=A0AAN7VRE1_9PEZI|nr:hypothetical protein LTR97_012202 [Elasticomyces elasticus]